MAALDPKPCTALLCPDCASGLWIEAVDDEPSPSDRVLCHDCGDIGTREHVLALILSKGRSAERRMADALTKVLRDHGPRTAW